MRSILQAIPRALLRSERLLTLAEKHLAAQDYTAAARDAAAVLARDPDHREALKTLVNARLRMNDMAGAFDAYRRFQALDRDAAWRVELCNDAVFRPELVAAGRPYVVELEDAIVDTTYWAIVHGGNVYNKEAYNRRIANSPLVGWRMSADEKTFIVAYPADASAIDDRCIFVGGDANYSHWITRSLLKLGLVEDDRYRRLPLLLHTPLKRFQVEYLELLEIAPERLIQVSPGAVVRCKRLVVPTQLALRPGFAAGVDWLLARLGQRLGPLPGPAADLLFLSRSDSADRVLVNEAELVAALAPLGFRAVVPGTMSVADQIRAFSRARAIVAAHGAGLTNMIFAPRDALIVEITSTNIAMMGDFRFMANALGQRMATIVSDAYDMDPARAAAIRPVQWDYRVAVDEVLAVLRRELPDVFARAEAGGRDR
jgi:capsular polysaccharide biosynthesis protein